MSDYEQKAADFKEETGLLAPSKEFEPGSAAHNERYIIWRKWLDDNANRV